VLRSYDNRACYTERRPDVYLYSGLTGDTKVVCDVSTGRPKSESDFGTYPKYSDTHVWLWKKDRVTSSRLLVIATPFRVGNHYATSPRDFVPVVEHLEQLHAAGYVHGDIRCFNMAMGPNGGLIDFDLGGKLHEGEGETTGVLTYPYGYNTAIADGTRLGRAEEPITKFHDAYALTKVIFELHVFQPGDIQRKPRLRRLLDAVIKRSFPDLDTKKRELGKFGRPKKDFDDLSETAIEETISAHTKELKKFLEDAAAQQWTVGPSRELVPELRKHGFFDTAGGGSTHRPA
jgi:hypothetical protein